MNLSRKPRFLYQLVTLISISLIGVGCIIFQKSISSNLENQIVKKTTEGGDQSLPTISATSNISEDPIIKISQKTFGEEKLIINANDYRGSIDSNLTWFFFNTHKSVKDIHSNSFDLTFKLCKIEKIIAGQMECFDQHLQDLNWEAYVYSFSPNGKYLAVSSTMSTWVFQLDPWQNVLAIIKNKTRPEIDWAPDNSGIILQFKDEKFAAEYLTLDGIIQPLLNISEAFPDGYPSNNYPPGITNWGPVWSPDGTKIAYIRNYSDKQELWVKNVTTGINQLVSVGVNNFVGVNPKWSPNGEKIATFDWDRFLVFDFASGKVKELMQISTTNTNPNYLNAEYSWSPDSKQIALGYYKDTNTEGIYVVEISTNDGYFIRDGMADILIWKGDGTIIFRANGNLGWINTK